MKNKKTVITGIVLGILGILALVAGLLAYYFYDTVTGIQVTCAGMGSVIISLMLFVAIWWKTK